MPRFGLDDVDSEVDHVLRDFLILDAVEIFLLIAHFIRIAQRDSKHSFAARLQRDDVFTRGEDDLAQRYHAFLANGFANDREGLLTDFAIRHDVIRIAHIKLVDLLARDELVDIDDVFTFDGDRLELVRFDLDIFAFGDLVALHDLGIVDFIAGFRVDFLIADAMAGLFVDLMEADLFPLRGRWKQSDRA